MRKLVIAALMLALIAGCSSTPTTQEGAPIEDKSGAGTTTAPGATTSPTSPGGVSGAQTPSGANPLRDPRSILSQRTVQFDFDSFVVKDQYRPLVEAHAKYLQANRNARLTLQGHADERGSREYNIALGQKRADAVKNMMLLFGATEVQIETVSYGKEKPKSEGHDESAWAINRRVEIIYAGE
jgi:peptidoglycan-associated lipoprotein